MPPRECPMRWDNPHENDDDHWGYHYCRFELGHTGPHKCQTPRCTSEEA